MKFPPAIVLRGYYPLVKLSFVQGVSLRQIYLITKNFNATSSAFILQVCSWFAHGQNHNHGFDMKYLDDSRIRNFNFILVRCLLVFCVIFQVIRVFIIRVFVFQNICIRKVTYSICYSGFFYNLFS